jgi:hypothetical protein
MLTSTYRTGHNQRGEGVYLYLWKAQGRKPRWVVADRHARRHYYARAVMEAHLRRELTPSEVVHHINGDATDDRVENLRLFASNAEHMKHEWETGAVKGRWV